MEPLSPGARAALDAYRREHAPDVQALRMQLAARVHAERAHGAPRSLRPRLFVISALTIAALGAISARRPEPRMLAEHAAVAERGLAPRASVLAAEAPWIAPPPAQPEPPPPPPPRVQRALERIAPAEVAQVVVAQSAVPPADEPTSPERAEAVGSVRVSVVGEREERQESASLDAEVMQIRTAYDLLREHAPLRALSALREHARRFPEGKLHELADVARVLALCDAGQLAAARHATAAYLRTHASSIHAARVREACGADRVTE